MRTSGELVLRVCMLLLGQDVLREKQNHIEQLIKERDLERAEITRAAGQADETEVKLATLQSEYEHYRSECERKLLEYTSVLSDLKVNRKDLLLQLEDEKRKNEDLQFKFEEAAITKGDIEVTNDLNVNKIKELEDQLVKEKQKVVDVLETESYKLFEAEEALVKSRDETEQLKKELDSNRLKRSILEGDQSTTTDLVESLQKQLETAKQDRQLYEDETSKAMAELTSKVTSVTSKLELAHKNHNIEVKDLKTKLEENDSKCGSQDEENKKLKEQLHEMKALLEEKSRALEELTVEKINNENNSKKMIEELQTELGAKVSSLNDNMAIIKQKDDEIIDVKTELEAKKTELLTKSFDLEKSLKQIQEDESNFKSELETVRKSVDTAVTEKETIQKDFAIKISQKDLELEHANKTISKYSAENAKLNMDIEELKESLDRTANEIHTRHIRQIEEKETHLVVMSSELQSKNEEITKCSIVTSKLEDDLCAKNNVIEKLRIELDGIKRRNEGDQQSITRLNEQINAMQLTIGDLQREVYIKEQQATEITQQKLLLESQIQSMLSSSGDHDTQQEQMNNELKLQLQKIEMSNAEYTQKLQNAERNQQELQINLQNALQQSARDKQIYEDKLKTLLETESMLRQRCEVSSAETAKVRDDLMLKVNEIRYELEQKELVLNKTVEQTAETERYLKEQLSRLTDELHRTTVECKEKLDREEREFIEMRKVLAEKSQILIETETNLRHVMAESQQNEETLKLMYEEHLTRLSSELKQNCTHGEEKDQKIIELGTQLSGAQALTTTLQRDVELLQFAKMESEKNYGAHSQECSILQNQVAALTDKVEYSERVINELKQQGNRYAQLLQTLQVTEQQKQTLISNLQNEASKGGDCERLLELVNGMPPSSIDEHSMALSELQVAIDTTQKKLSESDSKLQEQRNTIVNLQNELIKAQQAHAVMATGTTPEILNSVSLMHGHNTPTHITQTHPYFKFTPNLMQTASLASSLKDLRQRLQNLQRDKLYLINQLQNCGNENGNRNALLAWHQQIAQTEQQLSHVKHNVNNKNYVINKEKQGFNHLPSNSEAQSLLLELGNIRKVLQQKEIHISSLRDQLYALQTQTFTNTSARVPAHVIHPSVTVREIFRPCPKLPALRRPSSCLLPNEIAGGIDINGFTNFDKTNFRRDLYNLLLHQQLCARTEPALYSSNSNILPMDCPSPKTIVKQVPILTPPKTIIRTVPVPMIGQMQCPPPRVVVQRVPVAQPQHTIIKEVPVHLPPKVIIKTIPVPILNGNTCPPPKVVVQRVPVYQPPIIKEVPVTQPPRIIVKEVPVIQPPRVVVKQIPVPVRQGVSCPAPRIIVQKVPVYQPPRTIVKQIPVVQPPRVIIKEVSVPQPPRVIIRNVPVTLPPRIIVKNVPGPQDSRCPHLPYLVSPRDCLSPEAYVKSLGVAGFSSTEANTYKQYLLNLLQWNRQCVESMSVMRGQHQSQEINNLKLHINKPQLQPSTLVKHEPVPTSQCPRLPHLSTAYACVSPTAYVSDLNVAGYHPSEAETFKQNLLNILTQIQQCSLMQQQQYTSSTPLSDSLIRPSQISCPPPRTIVKQVPILTPPKTIIRTVPVPMIGHMQCPPPRVVVQRVPVDQPQHTIIKEVPVHLPPKVIVKTIPLPILNGNTCPPPKVIIQRVPVYQPPIIKEVPVTQPPRIIVKEVPVVQPPRIVVKQIPVPVRQGVSCPAPRIIVQKVPVYQPPRTIVKEIPVVQPPRVIIKEVSVPQPPRVIIRNVPVTLPPRVIVKNVPGPNDSRCPHLPYLVSPRGCLSPETYVKSLGVAGFSPTEADTYKQYLLNLLQWNRECGETMSIMRGQLQSQETNNLKPQINKPQLLQPSTLVKQVPVLTSQCPRLPHLSTAYACLSPTAYVSDLNVTGYHPSEAETFKQNLLNILTQIQQCSLMQQQQYTSFTSLSDSLIRPSPPSTIVKQVPIRAPPKTIIRPVPVPMIGHMQCPPPRVVVQRVPVAQPQHTIIREVPVHLPPKVIVKTIPVPILNGNTCPPPKVIIQRVPVYQPPIIKEVPVTQPPRIIVKEVPVLQPPRIVVKHVSVPLADGVKCPPPQVIVQKKPTYFPSQVINTEIPVVQPPRLIVMESNSQMNLQKKHSINDLHQTVAVQVQIIDNQKSEIYKLEQEIKSMLQKLSACSMYFSSGGAHSTTTNLFNPDYYLHRNPQQSLLVPIQNQCVEQLRKQSYLIQSLKLRLSNLLSIQSSTQQDKNYEAKSLGTILSKEKVLQHFPILNRKHSLNTIPIPVARVIKPIMPHIFKSSVKMSSRNDLLLASVAAMRASMVHTTQSLTHCMNAYFLQNLALNQSQVNNNQCTDHKQLLEDKLLAESQVQFLNSIIVDMQRKNEEQKSRIQILESGYSPQAAAELGLHGLHERKVPPRSYCDICEEFDLHETEDCPKQETDEDPHPGTRVDRKAKPAERPYCELCEVFGHCTEECNEDQTF